MTATDSFYEENAVRLAQQYDSLSFERVHESWQQYWPKEGDAVLDVGAGSGRDAKWFHIKGCKVVAVEPCAALYNIGKNQTGPSVMWLSDSLPDLKLIRSAQQRFDTILLSAVWMHLPPTARPVALANLSKLLTEGGSIVISLRHGGFDDLRTAYPVSVKELERLVDELSLQVRQVFNCSDALQRSKVNWQTIVLTSSK